MIPDGLKASSEAGDPPAERGEMMLMLRSASSETGDVHPAEWKVPSEPGAPPVGREGAVSKSRCDSWGVRNGSEQSPRPGEW